ncbi:MAG: lipid A-modifier LpxR family protein [Granulosicoccus sp.]
MTASFFLLLTILVLSTPLHAQQLFDQRESIKSGLSIRVDNDFFVNADLDKDYTGGIALAFSGRQALLSPFSFDGVRAKLNQLTGFNRLYDPGQTFKLHAIETGFVFFTPSDLSIEAPQPEEHPYASLFFLGNSQQVVAPTRQLAFNSMFTIGALGLDFAEDVHAGAHEATGSNPPKGWANQISSKGEITAKYSVGIQKLVAQKRLLFNQRAEFKVAAEGDIGFTTGAGVGFSARVGRIHTPWWGFNPQQSDYASQGSPMARHSNGLTGRDVFFYFGANINHNLYNAILQGQFKDSAVSYSASEINRTSTELWAGVSHQVSRHWNVAGFVRSHTPELKNTLKNSLWGGLTLNRSM